ncbi:MAG: hypothetical protein AB7O86_12250 [Porticoccaceae bacterium]
MQLTYVNPKYVDGNARAAAEFDSVLAATLPTWAADMSDGYAWNDSVPDSQDFQREADALANHLRNAYA